MVVVMMVMPVRGKGRTGDHEQKERCNEKLFHGMNVARPSAARRLKVAAGPRNQRTARIHDKMKDGVN